MTVRVRAAVSAASECAREARPWLVPAAAGTVLALAIGALGGGWRNGGVVGGAVAGLFGSAEHLLAENRSLRRRGGAR